MDPICRVRSLLPPHPPHAGFFTAMHKSTAHTDPIAYANRPLERGYDPMQAVRDMLARLIAGGKA